MATLMTTGDQMAAWCAELTEMVDRMTRTGLNAIAGPHHPEVLLQAMGEMTLTAMDMRRVADNMAAVIRRNNGHSKR